MATVKKEAKSILKAYQVSVGHTPILRLQAIYISQQRLYRA